MEQENEPDEPERHWSVFKQDLLAGLRADKAALIKTALVSALAAGILFLFRSKLPSAYIVPSLSFLVTVGYAVWQALCVAKRRRAEMCDAYKFYHSPREKALRHAKSAFEKGTEKAIKQRACEADVEESNQKFVIIDQARAKANQVKMLALRDLLESTWQCQFSFVATDPIALELSIDISRLELRVQSVQDTVAIVPALVPELGSISVRTTTLNGILFAADEVRSFQQQKLNLYLKYVTWADNVMSILDTERERLLQRKVDAEVFLNRLYKVSASSNARAKT